MKSAMGLILILAFILIGRGMASAESIPKKKYQYKSPHEVCRHLYYEKIDSFNKVKKCEKDHETKINIDLLKKVLGKVYYCSESHSTGFQAQGDGSYLSTQFKKEHFKLKFIEGHLPESPGDKYYLFLRINKRGETENSGICEMDEYFKTTIVCKEKDGMWIFNSKNLRFTHSNNSGFVMFDSDDVGIRMGECVLF